MPRPILMKNALFFIRWNRARLKKPSVSGVCGTVRMTKSARGNTRSSASARYSSATPSGLSLRALVDADDFDPKRGGQSRRLGPDPADPDDQRRRFRQMHDVSSSRGAGFHSRRSCCGK